MDRPPGPLIGPPPEGAGPIRASWTGLPGRSLGHHLKVLAVDLDLVDGYRAGGGQGLGLAGQQREGAAVLPALDLALLGPDLAVGEREVGVAAPVAQRVEVGADAH